MREVVAEPELVSRIRPVGDDSSGPSAVVAVVRRLLEGLALLDKAALATGNWAFVSFPASLMARSVLETLATAGKTFFEPGYWIQGVHQLDEVIEQQRTLLRRLEVQRTAVSDPQARAIRTVHVAWGIIRLGSKFLLRRREDKRRPEVQGFVFPGGRLDLIDLPSHKQSAEALRDLFRIDSDLAKEGRPQTLARELREELSLLPSDYVATHLRTLAPFQKVEGTRNNHVLTQYDIAVYSVKLSKAAELAVLDIQVDSPNDWLWFSASELFEGKRKDGNSAFIDALAADLGLGMNSFLVNEVPESGSICCAYTQKGDAIDLPSAVGRPLLKGDTGRERPVQVDLSPYEWELLMLLGWHAKGLQILPYGDAVSLLGAGWIRLNDDSLLSMAQHLAKKIAAMGFPLVEVDAMRHCRMSIASNLVYFNPECFEYRWQLETEDKEIVLTLKPIETHWAALVGQQLTVQLPANLIRAISAIERNKVPAENPQRECLRIFDPAKAIGLRKFIAASKGSFRIPVPCIGD